MEDLRLVSHGLKTLRASITRAQLQKKALSEVRMGTMAPWKSLPQIWNAIQVPGQPRLPRIKKGLCSLYALHLGIPTPQTQSTSIKALPLALLNIFSGPTCIRDHTLSFHPELKSLVPMPVP